MSIDLDLLDLPEGIEAEILEAYAPAAHHHVSHFVTWGPVAEACSGCGQTSARPSGCPLVVNDSNIGELEAADRQHGCGAWWDQSWRAIEFLDGTETTGQAQALVDDLAANLDGRTIEVD